MSASGTGFSLPGSGAGAWAGTAEASPAGCAAGDDAPLFFLSFITFFSLREEFTSLFFYFR
jgi:hypothetical protein